MNADSEVSQVSKASGEGSIENLEEGAVLNTQSQESEFDLLLKAVEAVVGELSGEEVKMLRDIYEQTGLPVELAVYFVEEARKKKRSPPSAPIDTPKLGGVKPLDSKY